MEKVSVREISRQTGFSPATVSKALNHKPGVSQKTIELIESVASRLGYQRPERLDQVRFVLARRTGGIIDESTFHPAVIEGVERQARSYGLATTFVNLDVSDTDSYRHEVEELCRDVSGAIVLLGTELEEGDFDAFADSPARLVVLDSWSDRHYFDAIVIANEDASFRAVRYLIGRGHRRIGYLGGSLRIQNFRYRKRGYLRALDEAGIVKSDLPVVTLGTTLEAAHRDMAAWLESAPEVPTAFFADNDVLAVGALRALSEAGLMVPDDVSIIGFDDLSFSSFSNPPLTTVHVPKHEIGELAVRTLMDSIENPQPYTRKIQISTTFVERESVRAL